MSYEIKYTGTKALQNCKDYLSIEGYYPVRAMVPEVLK